MKLGGLGDWLSSLREAGGEAVLYLLSGGFLGVAFSIVFREVFTKLGVVGNTLAVLCFGIAIAVFFITLGFTTRVVKKAKESRALAIATETAFRQGRNDLVQASECFERDSAPYRAWVSQQQEDENLTIPKIISLEITPRNPRLEVSVTLCPASNGPSVTVANLAVGWMDAGKPSWLPMFVGERVITGIETFATSFELQRSFNTTIPYPHLVGFSVTRNRKKWKDWSGQVDT